MRKSEFAKLIARFRCMDDAERYTKFVLKEPSILMKSAGELLSQIPPTSGACATLSALWAAYLNDNFDVPAVAVAGDLKIGSATIFQCKKDLFETTKKAGELKNFWDGHCWIEIDSYIGDLSVFRTAYAIQGPSVLKQFVLENFGAGGGAFLATREQLPSQMKYIPKFILNDRQISGLLGGIEEWI